jgi:hypothetical protein
MSNNILTLSLRPDVTVLAVPVEMNAHGFAIIGNVTLAYDYNGYTKKSLLLPPGSYELIGLLREVTEDVLGELLICQDSVLGPGMVYWSYTSESFTCPTAIISMKDAIYKAGGDPKQNWLIITKK